jgi:acetyl-CoA carboxylase/biotin carboxylase 1
MYKNGISHLTAASDLDGALQIVNYLMFVPGKLFDVSMFATS